jgi:hypothetical protein
MWKIIELFNEYEINDNNAQVREIDSDENLFQAESQDGYLTVTLFKNNKRYTRFVHRLMALTFLPNTENKPITDHIDNDRKNNTLSNLRWASAMENLQNTKLSKTNTSGVKGVTFNKKQQKYVAQITFQKKHVHIGSFKTLEEAKIARLTKSNELFCQFKNKCEN